MGLARCGAKPSRVLELAAREAAPRVILAASFP